MSTELTTERALLLMCHEVTCMWTHMTNIVELAQALGFEDQGDIAELVSSMDMLAQFNGKVEALRRQGLN